MTNDIDTPLLETPKKVGGQRMEEDLCCVRRCRGTRVYQAAGQNTIGAQVIKTELQTKTSTAKLDHSFLNGRFATFYKMTLI